MILCWLVPMMLVLTPVVVVLLAAETVRPRGAPLFGQACMPGGRWCRSRQVSRWPGLPHAVILAILGAVMQWDAGRVRAVPWYMAWPLA